MALSRTFTRFNFILAIAALPLIAATPYSVTAVGSSTVQFTPISTPFPTPLRVIVRDASSNPLSGIAVTFAAPVSGPGGVFSGNSTVATDTRGIATAPALTANAVGGTFTVTAAVTGLSMQVKFPLFATTPAGSFVSSSVPPSSFSHASGLATADFNGDGNLDLAVIAANQTLVQILLGDGKGGFSSSAAIDLNGRFPSSIAAGDLNGDGKTDLVVTTPLFNGVNVGSVSVFLGDGNGGFTAATGSPMAAGSSPSNAVVADFDGDGHLDVALINTSPTAPQASTARIFLGNGAGGLTAAPGGPIATGNKTVALASDDFNNDGRPDLAAVNNLDNNVAILINTGGGNFTNGSLIAVGGSGHPSSLTIADLNADGIPDLVVGSPDRTSIYLGDGNGSYAPNPQMPFLFTYGIWTTVGDFNGDGYPDIVVAPDDMFAGSAAGIFLRADLSPLHGSSAGNIMLTADVNKDGRPDLVEIDTYSFVRVLTGGTTQSALSLTSNVGSAGVVQPIALTARLLLSPNFNAPTNPITFSEGPTVLGTAAVVNGSATLTTSALSRGTHNLTASLAGDARIQAAASGVASVTVTAVPASIVATPGTPQRIPIFSSFGPLLVTVRDAASNPIAGAVVVFSVPATGPSGLLSNPTATTDTQGVAAMFISANATLGNYSVTASVGTVSTAFALTNVSELRLASAAPTSSSGSSGQFAAVFQDSFGVSPTRQLILVNTVLSGTNACLVQADNSGIYLANDADTALLGPLSPAGTLSNSQCTLNGNGSSAGEDPTGLSFRFTVSITFAPSFAGAKNFYVLADDSTGNSTGFQPQGTFNVTFVSKPSADSVLTPSGVGINTVFTATYSDQVGATALKRRLFLINSSLNGAGACFVQVDPTGIYLVTDAGTGLQPFTTSTSNSQCIVNSYTHNDISGTQSILTLDVTFKPGFTGLKEIFMYADDSLGANSGWQDKGPLTIPASIVRASGVFPSSGSGVTQTFTATYVDTAGVSALNRRLFLINATLNGAGGCFVQIDPSGIYLVNDADSALIGPFSTSLSNSQCTLIGASATSSANGTSVSLTITFNAAFAGPKIVYMYADDTYGSNSGWQQTGTYSLQGPAPLPPTAINVGPSSASGTSQIFTAVYGELSGAFNLRRRLLLINSILSGAGACFVQADQTGLYLVNDAGTGLLGPLSGTGSLTNSQCTLNPGGSIQDLGSTSTLTVTLTFKTSFAGAKNIYLYADDTFGNLSGWQTLGTYTVAGAPSAISVTPNAGSGQNQTFTAVYSDPFGAASFKRRLFLINSTLNGSGACFVQVDPSGIYLVNDSGNGLSPALAASGQLSGSQCTLSANGTSVTNSGNTSAVVLSLSFQPSFAGAKTIFMYAEDVSGINNGWQTAGTYSVSGPAPSPVSVSPGSGSGPTQTFTAIYTDPAGSSALNRRLLLFNSTLIGTGACLIQIDANGIFLANDADSALSAPLTSSGALSNSQCGIAGSGSGVTNSGNDSTVVLSITFKPAFAGAKTIFMYADDKANNNSGWQTKGTWTAQ